MTKPAKLILACLLCATVLGGIGLLVQWLVS
jgi:hypothetical protein